MHRRRVLGIWPGIPGYTGNYAQTLHSWFMIIDCSLYMIEATWLVSNLMFMDFWVKKTKTISTKNDTSELFLFCWRCYFSILTRRTDGRTNWRNFHIKLKVQTNNKLNHTCILIHYNILNIMLILFQDELDQSIEQEQHCKSNSKSSFIL